MINEAILVGNVGRKEAKQLKNGGELTVIALATTTKYMDSSGERQTRTTWHNVNCFNKLAEIAAKYVHVGDAIYIRGEINNKKVESGERAGQYMYSITAQDIRFLPNGKKKEKEAEEEHEAPKRKPAPKKHVTDYDDLNDDIPF